MKKIMLILLFCTQNLLAQQYQLEITKFRNHYKQEFLDDANSPLTKNDLNYLRFYEPNPSYLIKATFNKINDTIGFDMQTHSGLMKKYFVYGQIHFKLKEKDNDLFIYQSEKLKNQKGMEDYIFIPFTDETNSIETFGGGRYLDFKEKDIFHNLLIIDFNKCYNPYCAYKEGYSCPIPPKENNLSISIEAGEKMFMKK